MYTFTVFAPLFGFLIAGLLGPQLGDRMSQFITCALLGLSTFFAWLLFADSIMNGTTTILPLLSWIEVGDFKVMWSLKFDSLSTLMLIVVTTVSFLVHVYSIGYMENDPTIPRFMAYLSLFTFMMLMLVTADNLVQIFFGWEGVGLTSYLLIGYWYEKDSACAAAMKAFIVNRVGDLGLVLGLGLLFLTFGSLDISQILARVPDFSEDTFMAFGYTIPTLELAGIFLFIGAMGKSAQLGLHTWLPDAMEGPTPVSALIHAATMVTAGVFLVVRMSPLYEFAPFARDVIMVVGGITALFAGTVAIAQNDIKRVIAYSTCSQLGYMFFAAGAGAYSAAMFHLTTHAFFKALLFLGSGAVIHAMSDEQDMQKMGGLWKAIPMTCALMWIGNLALAGIPFFAGYYSKDLILSSTYLAPGWAGQFAFVMGLAAAFWTALYSWRLLWLTFYGKSRADETVMGHVHEAPISMSIPMILLAIGAIFSGYIFTQIGIFTDRAPQFFHHVVATPLAHTAVESVPGWVALLAKGLTILGISLGILFYGTFTKFPGWLAQRLQSTYQFLYNKWYFDELYEKIFVQPSLVLGMFLWKRGDGETIDGYGPDGVSTLTWRMANHASQIQTGYVYHYAGMMVTGIILATGVYLLYFIK